MTALQAFQARFRPLVPVAFAALNIVPGGTRPLRSLRVAQGEARFVQVTTHSTNGSCRAWLTAHSSIAIESTSRTYAERLLRAVAAECLRYVDLEALNTPRDRWENDQPPRPSAALWRDRRFGPRKRR